MEVDIDKDMGTDMETGTDTDTYLSNKQCFSALN